MRQGRQESRETGYFRISIANCCSYRNYQSSKKKWTSQNDTALASNYYLNVTLGVNIGDTNCIDFSFSLLKATRTFDTDCGIFEVLEVAWVGTALLHSV